MDQTLWFDDLCPVLIWPPWSVTVGRFFPRRCGSINLRHATAVLRQQRHLRTLWDLTLSELSSGFTPCPFGCPCVHWAVTAPTRSVYTRRAPLIRVLMMSLVSSVGWVSEATQSRSGDPPLGFSLAARTAGSLWTRIRRPCCTVLVNGCEMSGSGRVARSLLMAAKWAVQDVLHGPC